MLAAMSERHELLYGGALWVGPLFLLGFALLAGWLAAGPLTRRGRERAAARRRSPEELQEVRRAARARYARVERGESPEGTSERPRERT